MRSRTLAMQRPAMPLVWALTALLLMAAALGGCNTVEGIGQDVENAGDAVKDAVD